MSFECSSMLLGALMKQMKSLGFLSPRAVVLFDGFSLESVAEGVKGMRLPVWETYNEINELYPIRHAHSLEDTVVWDVARVVARAKGLVLADFLKGVRVRRSEGLVIVEQVVVSLSLRLLGFVSCLTPFFFCVREF